MDPVQLTLKYISFVTLTISFPGNLYIVVVNILDFFKNKRLPLSDQLILGFSVFSFLSGLHEWIILDLFQLHHKKYYEIDTPIQRFVNLCTLWFSTLLSIHFCLKIVNINHRFYICLQRRFPKSLHWMNVAILPGFFFINLYSAIQNRQECPNTTSTIVALKGHTRCYWSFLVFLIPCGLFTFLCSVSALTIIISLRKHIKKIEGNTEGSISPHMDAHIRAIKTVTTLLATNILIFISVFAFTVGFSQWGYLFCNLLSICHTLGSYFLIKGTKKLDTTLKVTLNLCPCVNINKQ